MKIHDTLLYRCMTVFIAIGVAVYAVCIVALVYLTRAVYMNGSTAWSVLFACWTVIHAYYWRLCLVDLRRRMKR